MHKFRLGFWRWPRRINVALKIGNQRSPLLLKKGIAGQSLDASHRALVEDRTKNGQQRIPRMPH
jgi:hypothetical protein